MNTDEVYTHDELLRLLEPEQFSKFNAFQRQQVINMIGPCADQDLKQAKARAIASLQVRRDRPIPGFNPHY